jgi:hypothetical protein
MRDDPDFMERINIDLAAREAARKILGIQENASEAQLKRAYRRAAKKHHPDRNENTPDANRRFTLVNCAYELLAFDKPCVEILEEINSWPGVPEGDEYRMDSPWGHFLWWREKFFDSGPKDKKQSSRGNSCI